MPQKLSQDKNKKLTDFFAPKPPSSRTPSDSPPSMPPSARPTAGPTIAATTRTRPLVSSSRPVTRSSKIVQDQNSTSSPHRLRSASVIATCKRPRSPDPIQSSIHILDTPPRRLRSERKPQELGSDFNYSKRLKSTVTITTRLSPRKTPHRPSLKQIDGTPRFTRNIVSIASPSDSSRLVVYSSQSDEAELALPVLESRDIGKVVHDVQRWRQHAFGSSDSSAPPSQNDTMQVDTPESPIPSQSSYSPHFDHSTRSVMTSVSSPILQTPTVASACLPSPPDTNKPPLLPLPPTPKAIDGETKAANIIAEIKAKAFAASQFSNDEKPLVFRDLEDSDDDDLVDDLLEVDAGNEKSSRFSAPRVMNDVFSSPLSSVPSTSNEVGPRTRSTSNRHSPESSLTRVKRASARSRKFPPAFCFPRTITTDEIAKSSSAASRKKSSQLNPLDALLREKQLADKRGTSSAAVRLAEEAIRQGSRQASVESEDALDKFDQLELADEKAAWKAIHEYRKSLSPTDLGNVDDLVVGSREAEMLGTTAGEAINKILANDKARKGKEMARNEENSKAFGVPLWKTPSDQDMHLDMYPLPPFIDNHPILARLERLHMSGDDSLFGLFLQSGLLASIPPEFMSSNIAQLLHLAVFASPPVADTIHVALRDVWEANSHNIKLPFSAILSILCRLGANPSTLTEIGWSVNGVYKSCMTRDKLMEVIQRLLVIIHTASLAGALSGEDVVDTVLGLVLIELDPLTSNELRIQLTVTMDTICNHGLTDILCPAVHEKVLSWARKLSPMNKARLILLFAAGGGRTRYIAQRLAYCMLIPVPIEFTDELPPLDPLILLLSPEVGSCELFDITNPLTDYEVLEHYVAIINVALVDIVQYVRVERDLAQSTNSTSMSGSPSKTKKVPVSPLEHLRKVLEIMQSKIVDTRAAYLDRSRTKAALQRLTMRLFYERNALLSGSRRPRASTIQNYFTPRRE